MGRYEMSDRGKRRESHVCIQIEMQGIMFHLWISLREISHPTSLLPRCPAQIFEGFR